jgi:DNA-binding CsgD family transcriptional regulator
MDCRVAPMWSVGVSGCVARPVTTVSREVVVRPASVYTPVELRLATEELDRARLALDAREYERARRLAEQAAAYAQIAEARAESESSRRLARQLRLTSEDLRAEAGRASVVALTPYPPLELRLAREELDSARLALDAREYNRARLLADRALADAQTAEARAATESDRQAARDLRLSIETVRNDASRLAAVY